MSLCHLHPRISPLCNVGWPDLVVEVVTEDLLVPRHQSVVGCAVGGGPSCREESIWRCKGATLLHTRDDININPIGIHKASDLAGWAGHSVTTILYRAEFL